MLYIILNHGFPFVLNGNVMTAESKEQAEKFMELAKCMFHGLNLTAHLERN
jgi:hypothetical protein